jgi:hypothetical protein
MPPTISDLLTALSESQVRDQLLAKLQADGFPATDWTDGAPERTLVEMDTAVLAQLFALIPDLAAASFVQLASGDWLELVAYYRYGLERTDATPRIGDATLTCALGNGPYTIAAGDLVALSSDGRRYINTTGGVLGAGPSTLDITLQSEFSVDTAVTAQNYLLDGAEEIETLVTPLPGVTITNPPATDYTDVVQVGGGSGTVTPSGTALGTRSYVIRIDTSGQAGVATVSYSLDGAAYVSVGATNPFVIAAPGTTVTLANGAVNPSFIAGDTYSFNAPGLWYTQSGADEETDAALRARCLARWPELGEVPNGDVYETWAREASTDVQQVALENDPTIPGKVIVYVAGQAGALSPTVVAAVESYIAVRRPQTDDSEVSSATNATLNITAGTVRYDASATLSVVQAATYAAAAAYVRLVGIGGTVRRSEVISAMETGVYSGLTVTEDELTAVNYLTTNVIDVTGLTFNGADADGNVLNSVPNVPVLDETDFTSSLTWTAV